jgi:tetratricopeptide (TPR) repeat protein
MESVIGFEKHHGGTMIAADPRRVLPGLDPGPVGFRVWGILGGKRRALVWIRAIVLVAAAALGLGAAPAPADLAPAVALSYRVEHLKTAFQSKDPAAIQAAVQEVELLRRTYGTLDVTPLVDAMVIFARQLGDRGQPALGLQVVQTLDFWAPNDPTLLGTRVMLMRQQGLRGYFLSIAEVMELTRFRLIHPVHRWLWALQHLAWLRLMASLLLWGWAVTLSLRYRRVFRYLWEEPLRRRHLNRHVVAFLGAFLLTFPVILGLDPSVSALLWLWLLTPFMLPLEIRATLFIVLLQLVHPALALMEPLASGRPHPSIVTLQMRPQAQPLDSRVWAALPSQDQEFLKGWRELQMQEWAQAEATFKALRGDHPDHAQVMNNLGVARFQQGDVAGAKTCFDEAAEVLSGSPEILLNQSVVAFKEMDSTLGTAKQVEASRAAPEAYNRMLAANHAREEQRTFAMPLPDTPARTRILDAEPGVREAPLLQDPDNPFVPRISAADAERDLAVLFNLLLPLAAAGAILLRNRKSINEAHPSQCSRCGDPFHTTDSPDTGVFSKCHHLFILKDGLHGESRKRKLDDVASYQKVQRRLHRMFLVFLPGADLSFIGNTWAGFTEYGFFCFAVGIVLATGRSVRYPGEIVADPASTWLPVGVALLAVLFLRSWLKLLPRRA